MIFKISLTIIPLILFVLLTNYDVSAQENTDDECKPIKTSIQTFEIDSDGRWKKVS